MSPRDFFVLVVRLMGVWLAALATSEFLYGLVNILAFLEPKVRSALSPGETIRAIIANGLAPTLRLIVAVFLLFRASWLYEWSYGRSRDSGGEAVVEIKVADFYAAAVRLLGLYAVIQSVGPVSDAIGVVCTYDRQVGLYGANLTPFLRVALYVLLALVLILGARRIGNWFASLRHH